jgi:hypothetical protein
MDFVKGKRFTTIFLFIAVAKLILICNFELGSGGFDAGEYARLSFEKYWTNSHSITIWDLRRGPGIPILSMIFRFIGVPYVLGLELLNLLLFYLLGTFSLKYFPLHLVVIAIICAVFSPATYTEQLLMSDQPFAIFFSLLLTTMAISIHKAKNHEQQGVYLAIAIGVFSFFSITLRDEGLLIYFLILFYLFILCRFFKKFDLRIAAKQILLTLLLVAAPIIS